MTNDPIIKEAHLHLRAINAQYFFLVKRVGTGEIVHRVDLSTGNIRRNQKVVAGLQRNMSDRFFVDDSNAYEMIP